MKEPLLRGTVKWQGRGVILMSGLALAFGYISTDRLIFLRTMHVHALKSVLCTFRTFPGAALIHCASGTNTLYKYVHAKRCRTNMYNCTVHCTVL